MQGPVDEPLGCPAAQLKRQSKRDVAMTDRHRMGKFHQLGYVCRNIDRAMETFAERCGVHKWGTMEGPMPQLGRVAVQKVALAFRGDIQIELIQPQLDIPSIYGNAIPTDEVSVRIHHLGYICDDEAEWDRVHAHHAKLGNPKVAGMDLDMVRYCYFDTFVDMGHFTEYFMPGPDMLAFWATLPRFP